MRTFPKLRVIRHRFFETNFPLPQPCPDPPHPLCYTTKKTRPQYGKLPLRGKNTYHQITGGNIPLDVKLKAMGISPDHMKTHKEVVEAVPPAYTRYIGRHILKHLAKKL
jgi:DNA (cytosine-5)-methyltransferase 1